MVFFYKNIPLQIFNKTITNIKQWFNKSLTTFAYNKDVN